MIKDMVPDLITSTHEVFDTMLGQRLTSDPPTMGEALRPRSNVVACVGMAGSVSGLVAIYSTMDTANVIAAGLLGMSPDELNGEMVDAIGETANMVAGSFRTRITERGISCDITVPTVTVGSDFYTSYVSNVERMMCPFQFTELEGNEIFVELIVSSSSRERGSASLTRACIDFGCRPAGGATGVDSSTLTVGRSAMWVVG